METNKENMVPVCNNASGSRVPTEEECPQKPIKIKESLVQNMNSNRNQAMFPGQEYFANIKDR